MSTDANQLLQQAELDVEEASDISELESVRVKYLGKKGLLTIELKNLKTLPVNQKRLIGEQINQSKKI